MGECLLVCRGGEIKKLPVLDYDYPKDMTVWGDGGSATFQVAISADGRPKDYSYQWYRDGELATWATGPTCTFYNLSQAKSYSVYCVVTNTAGSVTSRTAQLTVKNPNLAYTYTGDHELIDDGDDNWRIKFKSSGTLKFTSLGKWDGVLDLFMVGGGGASGVSWNISDWCGPGGGGYTKTVKRITAQANVEYPIVVGAGGVRATTSNTQTQGGTSSGFNNSVEGGWSGKSISGGNGGSGAASSNSTLNGTDGGDGQKGADGVGDAGKGQGTTTREFAESTGDLYASGGAYNVNNGTNNVGNGADNTGDGGGGTNNNNKQTKGGSGIVIIRNSRDNSITITQQPQDAEVALNANAVFTVAATGTGLTYQWQFSVPTDTTTWSNTSVSGYNTATLTVQALDYRANYRYRCVITDANGGQAVTSPATLTIAG